MNRVVLLTREESTGILEKFVLQLVVVAVAMEMAFAPVPVVCRVLKR